jgi:hypothetical protein
MKRPAVIYGILYVLIALAPALPLFLHPMSPPLHAPRGDIATTFWNFWWFDQTFWKGINPYDCPILFAPFGAKLYLHTFEVIDAFITAPIRFLIDGPSGIFLSWKVAFFLHAFWTCVAFHMLARALGLSHRVAAIGAVIIALSSMRQVAAPTLSVVATGYPLFLAWTVVRCLQNPGRARLGAWVGFACVLLLFANLYYLFFGVLLLGAAFIALLIAKRPSREFLIGVSKQLGFAALVGALPLAFFLSGALAQQKHLGTVQGYDRWVQVRGSAELIQFALPVWARALVTQTPAPRRAYQMIHSPGRAMSFVPPLVLLGVALGGAISRRKNPRDDEDDDDVAAPLHSRLGRIALLTVLGVSFVIALGPTIKLWTTLDPADVVFEGQTKPPAWTGISIPSPYALVANGPVFRQIRGNYRAGLFFTVALLLLMGPSIETAIRRGGNRLAERGVGRGMLMLALCGIIYFEVRPEFYQADPSPDFAGMKELREFPGVGGVREYPDFGYLLFGRAMYHQTVHGRPLLEGYLSRDPVGYDKWLDQRAWAQAFRSAEEFPAYELTHDERKIVLDEAEEDGLRFIIVNRDALLDERAQDLLLLFDRSKLGRVIYDDGSRAVLEIVYDAKP